MNLELISILQHSLPPLLPTSFYDQQEATEFEMIDFNSLNYYGKINFVFQNLSLLTWLFGTVGNVLLILVFSRRTLRKHGYSFYCRAKACADTLLILHTFRNLARFNLDANLDTVHPILCRFVNKFTANMVSTMSIGFMLMISIDRLLTVVYTNRLKFLKRPLAKWLICFFILVYSVLVNIILALQTDLITQQVGGNQTKVTCYASYVTLTTHSWIAIGNVLVVIFILNTLINIKLTLFILSSRNKVAESLKNSQRRSASCDRKFAISTIGISLIACVFKLPKLLVSIVTTSLNLNNDLFSMLFSVGVFIFDLESGCAFYVNMVMNSHFKQEFLNMFGKSKSQQSSANESQQSPLKIKTQTK